LLDLPTVRVRVIVKTFSMEYGQLVPGQEIEVQPLDGALWVQNGIAEPIAGVTPTAAAPSIAAGSATLTAGVLTHGQVTPLEQTNLQIQGLNVIPLNGHLAARKPGFFTVTLYLMTDRRVNGLASIRANGADYRSMPLVDSAGSKGHGSAATVTCIAVGNVTEKVEITAVFDNTDTLDANLIEGSLAMMGG